MLWKFTSYLVILDFSTQFCWVSGLCVCGHELLVGNHSCGGRRQRTLMLKPWQSAFLDRQPPEGLLVLLAKAPLGECVGICCQMNSRQCACSDEVDRWRLGSVNVRFSSWLLFEFQNHLEACQTKVPIPSPIVSLPGVFQGATMFRSCLGLLPLFIWWDPREE